MDKAQDLLLILALAKEMRTTFITVPEILDFIAFRVTTIKMLELTVKVRMM